MTELYLKVNRLDVMPDWATSTLPKGFYIVGNELVVYGGTNAYPMSMWIPMSDMAAEFVEATHATLEQQAGETRITVREAAVLIVAARTAPPALNAKDIVP